MTLEMHSHTVTTTDTSPMTIPNMLIQRAHEQPFDPLVHCGEVARNGEEMLEAVATTAHLLTIEGVQPGDTVALMSNNRIELLDFILGCAWMGAIAVPINAASRGEQLRHVLQNCGARVVISETAFVPHILEVADTSNLEFLWVLDGVNTHLVESIRQVTISPVPARQVTAIEPHRSQPSDTAAILYTSGTTGVSKGVECPQAQFYWWGRNMSEQLHLTSDDVLYTSLPLFHTNALNAFMQAVYSGASYVLGPKFSASRFWQQLHESGATVTYLLGAMVSILNKREPTSWDRHHNVRIALSPATPEILHQQFLERFGVLLLDGYGSTETNSIIGSTPQECKPGTMGKLRPGFEIRIVDELGFDVPVGTPGELLVRSNQPHAVATGYYNMPEATVKAWQDLWFHTGDRVVVDREGWYRFVDRIKDVIRRRGENISSVEVESALRKHPNIADVAVYPVDSELGEDEVMAALVVRTAVDFDEIARFCEPLVASFAIPRFMRIVEELPYTENGKVRKGVLREAGRSSAEWDRESQITR